MGPPTRMASKDRVDTTWAHRVWLERVPQPILVDYSGLRVRRSTPDTLLGQAGYRPIVLIVAAFIFLVLVVMPLPGSLVDLLGEDNPTGYDLMEADTQTIVDSVNRHKNPQAFEAFQDSGRSEEAARDLDSREDLARQALIMLGILIVAALLWGTEALPIAGTVTLVAVLMFAFGILPPNEIAKAFMNDAVLFILGVLAVAVGVSRTGLDKRIGLLLLSRIRSAGAFAFIFFPVFALCSAFLSAHALVALLVPVMMGVYKATCMNHGLERDRVLAIFLFLGMTFAANIGGPGSPAAGARNAVMLGFLADAGYPIGFGEWIKYGLPLVPVLALTVGAYMYIRCKSKLLVKTVNPSAVVKQEVAKLPRFGGKEAVMAVILGGLVITWINFQDTFGIGGATLTAVLAMFICRIVTWDDIQKGVAFDVVGLYGAASAIAVGLAFTGGGLWLAIQATEMLPGYLSEGNGLIMGVSIMTGTLTNFMSDGATVATLGPLALPMAELANISIWKMGLMVSFASSLANVLVVGTPNNAIVFAMSKDPDSGKRLLSVFDFIKYGLPLTIILLLVMWGWALFGYWAILSWP